MHKIKKYQLGKSLDINYQLPSVNKFAPNLPSLTTTTLMPPSMPLFKGSLGNRQINDIKNLNFKIDERFNKPNTTSIIAKNLGDLFVNFLSGTLSDGLIGDDSELGRSVGNIMSGALGTAGSTIIDNISKGNVITEGLQKNVGSTVSGIAGGLAANYAGQGISSLMGNSNLGKFTGGVASSALGQILGGGVGNPINFASNALGAGLSAMTGPSKEYGGKYGNVTQTMDAIYGTALGVVGMMGPVGAAISAGMALNKGLSNIFGSTSGMTIQDSILGSAFMPAPVKWLNMAGSKTTDTFKNQSWLNSEKTNRFMGNAFGNLGDKFDKAREEAGKTYGTFSRGAYNDAQDNINFANYAWNKILAMADQNELQNIRSLYMTSINNLRYALNIQGGWNPLAVGKQGMKILNNATNHNMGMRLLSAAALIDDKQMILSALTGTKLYGAKKFRAMSEEELKNRKPEIVVSQTTPKTPEELNAEWERTHPNGGNADPNLSRVSDLTSEVFNQTTKPPFTGQEYLEAAEALRQKKVDKFHEAEKIGEATLMADMAVSAAPLLQRGFRWVFNKAGLLVKIPMLKTSYSVGLPGYPHYYNPTTNQWDFSSAASDVKQGIDNLREWMNNPVYRKAAEANKAEAEAMGLTYIPYYERPEYIRALENPNIKFKNLNSSVGGESNLSGEVTINTGTTLNPILVVRHEMGHVAGLGKISEAAAVNPNNTLLLKELKYLRYKSNQVYKEGSEYAGQVDLNRNSFEGIQNARDFGEELGIKIGQEYPGYEKALEIVNSYPENGFKAGLKKMFRLDKEHMPYVWKALAGTLFTLAATLYNSHKKGGKILKAQKGTKLYSLNRGNKDNIFKYTNSNGDVRYVYRDNPEDEEVPVRPLNTIFPDPAQWTFTDDAGRFYTPRRTTATNTAELNPDNRTGFERALDNYIGEAFNTVPKGYHTLPAIGAAAFGLANPAIGEAALTSGFGAHGLSKWMNGEVSGPLDAAMTALEVAPLGRLAKPMWDAGKQGLQYTTKAIDNATRHALPSYDLYRTVGETTPSVRVRDPYVDVKGLKGTDKSYIKIKSSLEDLTDAKRGIKNEAYYLFAPKDIDILKLRNARFGNGNAYDGPILSSGSVDGKFVSYGEPWMEFAPGENRALYEMPTGPRRGPSLMATDFRGNRMDYSVDEAYNAVLRNRQFQQDIKNMELDDILQFKRDNYPDLIGGIPTDIYHANQTVIPNKNWNFDKFLKTPLWKYSEDSASGQVQKELMMKWPEAKPLETSTIEWTDAAKTPQITSENAASITPKVTHFYHGSPVRFDAFSADFIGSGEGGSKVMQGINLWPEERIGNAPKLANIRSSDAPIHLGVPSTPLGGELNPTVYDVSGRGLKLYTASPREVKSLNQSDLISQGYDGIQTPNQVTVFPESISKLSIDKQSSIEDFVMSHPEVERWNPWTTDSQKMQNIIDRSKMSKWTPEQWTAAQDAAIARGDMAEAQRLRDLHFKVNAPDTKMIDVNGNPIHNYHGSPSKNITIFRENAKKIPFHGKNRIGIYFTENKKRAFEFAGTKRKVYDTYLNLKNPYRQSYRQTFLNNFKNLNPFKNKHYFTSEYITTADLSNTLKGYDGAITKGTENVALKSNQIKLADAVTYDDKGVRIPLGERDNFKLNDIRYGWLPWFLGGSTAATLYNTNK